MTPLVPPPGVWIWGRGKAGGAARPICAPCLSPAGTAQPRPRISARRRAGRRSGSSTSGCPRGRRSFIFGTCRYWGGWGGLWVLLPSPFASHPPHFPAWGTDKGNSPLEKRPHELVLMLKFCVEREQ